MTGLYFGRRYEKDMLRNLFWAIWYPLVYWMLSRLTTALAIPEVLLRDGRERYVC